MVSESSGDTVTLSCKFPCKYYSYEKYWCKWSSQDCEALPTQEEDASDDVVNCRLISKVLSVNAGDNGWYWCGVKQDQNYGEALAVHVPLGATVEDTVKGESPGVEPAPQNPRGRALPKLPTASCPGAALRFGCRSLHESLFAKCHRTCFIPHAAIS